MLKANEEILKKHKLWGVKYTGGEFHIYTLKGQPMNRSVSDLVNIAEANLGAIDKKYAEIGTAFHKVIENVANGRDFEPIEEDIVIENFNKGEKIGETRCNNKLLMKFRSKCLRKWANHEFIASECQIIDKRKRVPGTLDLITRDKSGKVILWDFKTAKEVTLNHVLQLNIYKRICRVNYKKELPNIDKIICCTIDRKTGNMKNHQIIDISNTIWEKLPPLAWEYKHDFESFNYHGELEIALPQPSNDFALELPKASDGFEL